MLGGAISRECGAYPYAISKGFVSLRICVDLPEPSQIANTGFGCRLGLGHIEKNNNKKQLTLLAIKLTLTFAYHYYVVDRLDIITQDTHNCFSLKL